MFKLDPRRQSLPARIRKGNTMSHARPVTLFFTVCLVLATAATVALAGSADDPFDGMPDPFALEGECRIGNLNPPVGPSYPEIFTGNQAFAYYVKPASQCSCAEERFKLEAISMLVDFDPNQIPQTLVITPSLLTAVFNPGSDCFEPGSPLCAGPDQIVTIDVPGIQTLTVPLDGCGPFPLGDDYFLSLSFEGGGPALLPVDDEPLPCVEYVNPGNGWTDLFGQKSGGDKTGGGKVIVFGDIVCVTAVDVEPSAWGSIKSLYR
jgi:hypothetical protein